MQTPTLTLAHGRAGLSLEFRELQDSGQRGEDSATCTDWLRDSRRRALLADIGIGTIDQALLSVLPVKHQTLRHFGLSSKVLIVDEVHEMGEPYIGQELVRQNRQVLFTTCSLLVQELLVAKSELKLPKALKRLSRFEALIIDDIAYVQHNREEMEVLFTLLAERYERGSVLLTSNLPFSGWEQIFKDAMTTAAAIDRLVHHSVILELNVSSYRLESAKAPDSDRAKEASKTGAK